MHLNLFKTNPFYLYLHNQNIITLYEERTGTLAISNDGTYYLVPRAGGGIADSLFAHFSVKQKLFGF